MRPLRRGKARTELTDGLAKLATVKMRDDGLLSLAASVAQLQAAVLGGAIEQAIDDLHINEAPAQRTDYKRDFWRLTNENLWRLTRALEASRLLDKAGDA